MLTDALKYSLTYLLTEFTYLFTYLLTISGRTRRTTEYRGIFTVRIGAQDRWYDATLLLDTSKL